MLKEGNCNGHEEGDSLNVFRWWWCLPLPEQWWWKEWWWRQWICRLLCAVVYLSLQLTDPQHLTLPPKIPKEPHPQKYHQKYPTPSYTQPPPEGVVKQSLQQGTQFQYQRKILAQLSPLVNPICPFTSQPIKCSTCSSFMTGGRRAWEPVKGAGVVEQPQQGHWCGFNGEDYCNSRLSLTFMN